MHASPGRGAGPPGSQLQLAIRTVRPEGSVCTGTELLGAQTCCAGPGRWPWRAPHSSPLASRVPDPHWLALLGPATLDPTPALSRLPYAHLSNTFCEPRAWGVAGARRMPPDSLTATSYNNLASSSRRPAVSRQAGSAPGYPRHWLMLTRAATHSPRSPGEALLPRRCPPSGATHCAPSGLSPPTPVLRNQEARGSLRKGTFGGQVGMKADGGREIWGE